MQHHASACGVVQRVAWRVRALNDARFSRQLGLIRKTLAVSRGQLAASLAVDKSIVSRWLSGATVPNDHNLARLTALVAETVPGFSMFDWERDDGGFATRLGLIADGDGRFSPLGNDATMPQPAIVADPARPLTDLPDFARLPAFASALHDTAARGSRYCGLWRAWMPTYGRPDAFHCEHTVLWQEGAWLAGFALGVSYRWPLVGFIANGQLLLIMSDANDFVLRQFSRADEPIIDQIDGLMLAAASLPNQTPTACRVIMERVLHADASRDAIDAAIEDLAAERQFLAAADLRDGMAADLLPDSGPAAASIGGERLLRADMLLNLVKTRWY
jgi:hypothetical protein